MSFLASVLESYEGLVAGKIGNPNMIKEDYNQVDPKEVELMDIRWCMTSVIRRALRFMEITGRKCLEGPDMEIGFDKAKVTCFKCKQKGHFKRECTNNKEDDSVNPYHDDYYKKAIYHRNNEQLSKKQIDEGSSKEKKQAMLTIRDGSSGPSTIQDENRWKIQDNEGFNWNKYIKDERTEKWVSAAEFKQSREEEHA
ncbi:putative transcription factor interactor and regulator CCHC(Zn) family [Helianthus annuus]|nr:putative transcription factor interactor and regulator CCHC(Zn) family [Helianthus annuus]